MSGREDFVLENSGLRITTNHISSATMENTSTVRFFKRVSDLAQHPPVYGLIMNQSFVNGREENRIESFKALRPSRVSYNGLPGYKQVMMHKIYLSFIPEQYRCDQLYCKPSKEVLDAEEKDQEERSQYKKMKGSKIGSEA
jgi:hypothetical protein